MAVKDVVGALDELRGTIEKSSGLPAVTGEDNGNVLTVVEGKWAKAVPSGGGGAFMINATVQEISTDRYLVLDKTFAEIATAAQTSQCIISISPEEGFCFFCSVVGIENNEGNHIIDAVMFALNGQDVQTVGYMFSCETANDYPKMAAQ